MGRSAASPQWLADSTLRAQRRRAKPQRVAVMVERGFERGLFAQAFLQVARDGREHDDEDHERQEAGARRRRECHLAGYKGQPRANVIVVVQIDRRSAAPPTPCERTRTERQGLPDSNLGHQKY
eukprot:SAG31_NODE_888_length_11219_cov_5.584712_7_plen_124_part_00